MDYLIVFLEGILTFVSPCFLPMLPLYLLYFAGNTQDGEKNRPLVNAIGFVVGFSLVFMLLGAFASVFGSWLNEYRNWINFIGGALIVLFGLNMLGVFRLNLFNGSKAPNRFVNPLGFVSAIAFGMVFAISWTPCVGAYLASALLLASSQATTLKGVLMLLVYALGLGIPLIISAALVDTLKKTLESIKKHYQTINRISGGLLIAMGLMMMLGWMNKLLGWLSF